MFEISRGGSGAMTAMEIIHDTSSNSVNTGIKMALSSNNPTLCYGFRFDGTEVAAGAVGGSQDKKLRVSVSGTDYYVALNTT